MIRHNFRNIVNIMCSCGPGTETTDLCLLCGQSFALVRSSFLNRIIKVNVEFRNMNDLFPIMIYLLLLGSEKQTFDVNTKILNLIQFLKSVVDLMSP